MSFRKGILAAVAALLLAFSLSVWAAGAENGATAKVSGSDVRLRGAGNTNSAILAVMKKGSELTVVERSGDWYKVIFGEQTGYVLATYITLDETPVPSAETVAIPADAVDALTDVNLTLGAINAANVRLRAAGNTNADILATMSRRTQLSVLDYSGEWYKVQAGDKVGYVLGVYVTLGEEAQAIIEGTSAEQVDWFSEGKYIMKPGVKATVTDVATGISFQVKVLANGNHADVEPMTAEDTAKILKIRGKFSWTPRAIWVSVDGRTIAASCNGMPHDVSNIKNNDFPGHFCIHFYNSKNHYNGKVDPAHQAQVQIALNS